MVVVLRDRLSILVVLSLAVDVQLGVFDLFVLSLVVGQRNW